MTVGRNEWSERLKDERNLDLRTWYDLSKIRQTLVSVKNRQVFRIEGLYDISNGKFDKDVEIDSRNCDYIIVEGLFSFDEALDQVVDLRVFIDRPVDTAIHSAEDRDETVRHLDDHGWEQKKAIYYDHYLPFIDDHKKRTDIILEIE